ncbi:MAG: TspO/MBR family protein [Pseudomonadota bacterium]
MPDTPAPTPAQTLTHRTRFFALIAFMVLCLIISAAGGAVTATSVGDWYQTLTKPVFSPPDWLFAPVWTVIYFMIALSGWRAWLVGGFRQRTGGRDAFAIYGAQLFLNLAWSFLFFGAQSPIAGLVGIVPLFCLIIVNIMLFARIDRWAAYLLVPYALWVGFATALNGAIWWLNR